VTGLATFDPQTAAAAELRQFAVAARDVIPTLGTEDELNNLEAVLVAVAKRLRQIGLDAGEAEKSRTLAVQRIGDLLPPAKETQGSRADLYPNEHKLSDAERKRRAMARLLAEQRKVVADLLAKPQMTLNQAVKAARERRHEHEASTAATGTALVSFADWREWLPDQDECDLLLTDPPYSTDLADVYSFANSWLPEALKKVRATGRAYVCIGAYPEELHAYLSVPCSELTLANVLVWTYRNTLGPSPTHDYKLNWQAILYYRGPDAPPLDSPKMTEQFTVQDINAPDGRQGDRWHA
jgi:hypothetical protein